MQNLQNLVLEGWFPPILLESKLHGGLPKNHQDPTNRCRVICKTTISLILKFAAQRQNFGFVHRVPQKSDFRRTACLWSSFQACNCYLYTRKTWFTWNNCMSGWSTKNRVPAVSESHFFGAPCVVIFICSLVWGPEVLLFATLFSPR